MTLKNLISFSFKKRYYEAIGELIMKNPVAKRSAVGISKNDIIAINAEAKKREQEGVKVINASIGTFLTEEKKVGSVSLMKEGLSSHITEQLGYPSVNGNSEYLSSVMDYLFDGYQEKLNELYHPFIGATIGGTGALSMAFQMFLEEGDPVLLPDVMWTNYKLISKKAHSSYETYQMFTEDSKINFSSLREKLIKSMKSMREHCLSSMILVKIQPDTAWKKKSMSHSSTCSMKLEKKVF